MNGNYGLCISLKTPKDIPPSEILIAVVILFLLRPYKGH